jgi:hypothetical protein
MQPGPEPPSASMGVEGSGAVSGAEKMAAMEKSEVKESIEVLIGGFVSELLGSCWKECPFVSLSFIRFMAHVRHKPLRKNDNRVVGRFRDGVPAIWRD